MASGIEKQFAPPTNVNKVHKESLTPLEKLAVLVTDKIGTMGFFFIIFVWTIAWLTWNIVAPNKLKFDPFPAFVLWLFISNLIQIHLMPLIMVGQNIQGKHAELRAEYDFQTDTKTAKVVEAILSQLDNQEKLMRQILERLEKLEKIKSLKF